VERALRSAGAARRARLAALVYQGYLPYEHSGLDLDTVDLAGALAFHARRHGPGNAVLAIAGDVDVEATMALVHRHFDDLARAPATSFTDPGLPEQTSQRTAAIHDDRAPAVLYGWAVPPVRTPEHLAVELLGEILAGGEGSRLHRTLVREKGLATAVSAGAEQRRGPDLFRVEAALAPGAKPADVERAIEAEIKALSTRGPTPAELLRARRRVASAFLLGLGSNQDRARRLAEHELCFGDARLLPADLGRALGVTSEEIMRAAAQHLGPTRRTLVEALAPGEPKAEAAPVKAAPAAAPAPPKSPAQPTKKRSAKPRKKKP
jgi:zinc protease